MILVMDVLMKPGESYDGLIAQTGFVLKTRQLAFDIMIY